MFTKRQLRILELIIRNSYGITGSRMAEVLSVSSRTIRSDIVVINTILKEYDFMIKSSSKKGYYIDNEKYQDMCSFIRPYLSKSLDDKNRMYAIVGRVLFDGKQYFLDLSEELDLSEQTLYKVCQKIKNYFVRQYNFNYFVIKSEYIDINCKEEEVRQLLLQLTIELIMSKRSDYLIQIELLLNDNFFDNEYQKILNIIKEKAESIYMVIEGQSLDMIALAFYMMIVRNRSQFYIENPISNKAAYSFVDLMIEELSNCDFEINENDGLLLNDFCWGIKMSCANDQINISSQCYEVLSEFCQKVADRFHVYFLESTETIQYLSTHIEYMIRRIETKYELKNPIIYEIKKMYPVSYEIAIVLSDVIYKHVKCYPNDDELSYITLYIENFLHNYNRKLRVVIVSEARPGLNYMIESWLKNNFSYRMNFYGFVTLHDLDTFIKNNHIDIVISSRRITQSMKIPYYVMEGIPNKRDFELLTSLVHRISDNNQFEEIVKELFSPEIIQYFNHNEDFNDVILQLSKQLYQNGYIENVEDFSQRVIERETLYSTVINSKIALPHPLINKEKKSGVAVGILKNPISLNNKDVKLVFLLAFNKEDDIEMCYLLDFIRRISLNKENSIELTSSNNSKQFLQKIVYLSKNIQ